MRKILYISLLLMSFFSAAEAQKKFIYEDTSLLQNDEDLIDTETKTVTYDGDLLTEDRALDTFLYKNGLDMSFDSVKKWKNSKDYAYLSTLDSLLKNRDKKRQEVEPSSGSSGGFFNSLLGSGFVSVLLWTLAILFVLFIVYRLFLADGVFKRKAKSSNAIIAETDEEIITNESDFDALIRVALQSGNYRQAVRYQYLRTLHTLADRNLLELAPDKTNFQYVQEIKNREHQNDFAGLTLNYEYVWYGEFDIDQQIYQKIEPGFTGLNKKLKIN